MIKWFIMQQPCFQWPCYCTQIIYDEQYWRQRQACRVFQWCCRASNSHLTRQFSQLQWSKISCIFHSSRWSVYSFSTSWGWSHLSPTNSFTFLYKAVVGPSHLLHHSGFIIFILYDSLRVAFCHGFATRVHRQQNSGVVLSLGNVAGVRDHLDVDQLFWNDPNAFNLFLLALQELKYPSMTADIMGYFETAGTYQAGHT